VVSTADGDDGRRRHPGARLGELPRASGGDDPHGAPVSTPRVLKGEIRGSVSSQNGIGSRPVEPLRHAAGVGSARRGVSR
jgi:hypothetical protein